MFDRAFLIMAVYTVSLGELIIAVTGSHAPESNYIMLGVVVSGWVGRLIGERIGFNRGKNATLDAGRNYRRNRP